MAKQNRRKRSKKGELKVELKCATCYRLFMAARRRDPAYCKPKCRVKAMRKRNAKAARRTGYTDPIIPFSTASTNGNYGTPQYRCGICRKVYLRSTYQDLRDPETPLCSRRCADIHGAALVAAGITENDPTVNPAHPPKPTHKLLNSHPANQIALDL